MARKSIIITQYDKKRLETFINDDLRKELNRAKVLDPKDIPDNVLALGIPARVVKILK